MLFSIQRSLHIHTVWFGFNLKKVQHDGIGYEILLFPASNMPVVIMMKVFFLLFWERLPTFLPLTARQNVCNVAFLSKSFSKFIRLASYRNSMTLYSKVLCCFALELFNLESLFEMELLFVFFQCFVTARRSPLFFLESTTSVFVISLGLSCWETAASQTIKTISILCQYKMMIIGLK